MGRGGVSPSHFFYAMTFPEAAAFLRGFQSKDMDNWERCRRLYYIMAQTHSDKELDEREIMPLWFDRKEEVDEVAEAEKIKELRKRAKNMKL